MEDRGDMRDRRIQPKSGRPIGRPFLFACVDSCTGDLRQPGAMEGNHLSVFGK